MGTDYVKVNPAGRRFRGAGTLIKDPRRQTQGPVWADGG